MTYLPDISLNNEMVATILCFKSYLFLGCANKPLIKKQKPGPSLLCSPAFVFDDNDACLWGCFFLKIIYFFFFISDIYLLTEQRAEDEFQDITREYIVLNLLLWYFLKLNKVKFILNLKYTSQPFFPFKIQWHLLWKKCNTFGILTGWCS